MIDNQDPPFELTIEALASWLDALSRLPASSAANQLNQALKQLKNIENNVPVLLPLLINLTPLTLHLSNSLAATALAETNTSRKANKIAKLSMHLLRQLSLLFCKLIENDGLEPAQLQTSIYYALQLIGYALRCYSLFYEIPSATLWKKAASLYLVAADSHCLQQQQPNKVAEFKMQLSIEAVIKRNLLFSICYPSLYRREEINQLFVLANRHGDGLVISRQQPAEHFDFYWDLNSDVPPCPVRYINRPLTEGFLAIDSQCVGHALQHGEITTSLHPSIQNKLAMHLSGYEQIFNSIIPGLPSRTQLVFGFERICAYLQEQNKLSKIMHFGAQPSNTKTDTQGMTLVPMAHQRNVFDAVEQPFAKPLSAGRAVNILKTPNNAYAIAEGRSFDCASGDLALLYKDQYPSALVIIRQQTLHDLSGSTHILLEKIPGACSIRSFGSGSNSHQAIIVSEDSDYPELFLPSGKYTIDSQIPLTTGKVLRLIACLESNAFFARFKISFD